MAKSTKTKTTKRRKTAPLTVRSSHSRSMSLQGVEGAEILQGNQYKSLALRSMFWRPDYLQGSSAWIEHLPFAFWIIEALQPSLFVELGTHYGHSYFSFCQAIKRLGLNTPSYAVDTWKGDDQAGHYDESVYQQVEAYNQANYPEFSSLLRSTFDEALSRFNDGSIDLLHIDGFHTYEAVRHDFESWLPKLSDRAVVIFHDTNVRRDLFGVHKYFAELTCKYPHFEFIHGHGLGVLGVGKEQPELMRSLYTCYAHQPSRNIVYELFSRLGRSCHDLMDLNDARNHAHQIRTESEARHHHIVHLEQVAGERGAEIERLNGEIARVKDEDLARQRQLEETIGIQTTEVERHKGEVARLVEDVASITEQKVHLERVAGERAAEIDRLNGEVGRLNEERLNLEKASVEQLEEIDRLQNELLEKSDSLDRYIQESAQMARMIRDQKLRLNAWRDLCVTTDVRIVEPGISHESGEHQHINYQLFGINQLGRAFNKLDVRIVNHRGNAGLVIFRPEEGERPFYGWEPSGQEQGRDYMLILPNEKKSREWLVRATSNDLLLCRGIASTICHDIKIRLQGKPPWHDPCIDVIDQIDSLPPRLHYDDVRVLSKDLGIISAELVNPSYRSRLLKYTYLIFQGKKLTAVAERDGVNRLEMDGDALTPREKQIRDIYRKEAPNLYYHLVT